MRRGGGGADGLDPALGGAFGEHQVLLGGSGADLGEGHSGGGNLGAAAVEGGGHVAVGAAGGVGALDLDVEGGGAAVGDVEDDDHVALVVVQVNGGAVEVAGADSGGGQGEVLELLQAGGQDGHGSVLRGSGGLGGFGPGGLGGDVLGRLSRRSGRGRRLSFNSFPHAN